MSAKWWDIDYSQGCGHLIPLALTIKQNRAIPAKVCLAGGWLCNRPTGHKGDHENRAVSGVLLAKERTYSGAGTL